MAFLSIPTQVGLAVMQNKTTWRNAILAEHLVIFVCVILIRWRPVSSHIQTNIDKDEYYQHHQLERPLFNILDHKIVLLSEIGKIDFFNLFLQLLYQIVCL